MLEANLAALAQHSPEAAARVRESVARAGMRAVVGDDGGVSVEIEVGAGGGGGGGGGGAVALASRRRPRDEAERLAASVDIRSAAVLVVSGFGAGHHVRALAKRVDRAGLVVVFEPNVDVLRGVLERVDHSAWLGSANLRVLTDAEDRGAMSEALRGCEGLVGMGVGLVEHAPSKGLIGEAGGVFYRRLSEVVDATKMAVLTTLVQVRQTLRNQTQNLDRYVMSGGVADLKGTARGRAGIVIAAGPSLARNVHVLKREGVRERFVLVAVQTVLKSLLKMGIRPEYVTALDYSEISRRFYEGLTAEDVRGITLIAEAKVNPAVLEAWPGEVRTPRDATLDRLLGEGGGGMTREKGALAAGATVAHLAYYFARHVGCDPVALIGQDLGFTDGQYYGDGAAIHTVWGGELNGFNTLEMLEWQRIVRMGTHLRRATDVLGRDVFTDEQMTAYLAQFERDFKQDAGRGLTTIDASEGGVRKQHTRAMRLEEFVEAFWDGGARGEGREAGGREQRSEVRGPGVEVAHAERGDAREVMRALEARVQKVRGQVFRVGQASRRAQGMLSEVIEHQADQARVNRVIGALEGVTREAMDEDPGYGLVHMLAQVGTFQRVKADRLIYLDKDQDEMTRQRRRAERDRTNVEMLAKAADELGAMLDDCVRTLRGGPRVVREPGRGERSEVRGEGAEASHAERGGTQGRGKGLEVRGEGGEKAPHAERGGTRARGVCDVVVVHGEEDEGVLARAIARAVRVGVGRVRVVTGRGEVARAAVVRAGAGAGADGVDVIEVAEDARARYRRAVVRAARGPALACWRGGIGNASVFDEVIDPAVLWRVCGGDGAGAVMVVGGAWVMVDVAVSRGLVERYWEDPASMRMTFSQATPGVAGCVLGPELLGQIGPAAERATEAGAVLGTMMGAVLGYSPLAPIGDLIATARCVGVDTAVRDAGERMIADSAARRARAEKVLSAVGEAADAGAVVARWKAEGEGEDGCTPREVVVPAAVLSAGAEAAAIVRAAMAHGEVALVTIGTGHDEPCAGDAARVLSAVVDGLRARGVVVHVRTGLRAVAGAAGVEACVQAAAGSGAEIVSVDVFADQDATYRAITGRGDFAAVRGGVEELLAARLTAGNFADGRGPLLVVPRLMRCDAAYADVETFYHRWLHHAGCAVIDPPRGERGERGGLERGGLERGGLDRIRALTVPGHAAARLAKSVRVLSVSEVRG